jgi:hypothetical protein
VAVGARAPGLGRGLPEVPLSAPIAADRTWRLPWRRLDLLLFREACVAVAARYAGVVVRVEVEDTDTHTAFFEIPSPDELRARLSSAAPADAAAGAGAGPVDPLATDPAPDAEPDAELDRDADPDAWEEDEEAGGTVELSLYDMDGDGVFLSLEADASDNGLLVEEADEIADLLADRLRAEPVDL